MLIVIVKDMNKAVALIKPADPPGKKNRQDFKSEIGATNLELAFIKAVKRCSSATALYMFYREIWVHFYLFVMKKHLDALGVSFCKRKFSISLFK